MKNSIELNAAINNNSINTELNRPVYNNGYCTKVLRDRIRAAVAECTEDIMNGKPGAKKVSISIGNVKMGAIPSVSLPPYITCPAACKGTCDGKCYAGKICMLRKNVLKSYAKNLAIFQADPDGFFKQVSVVSGMYRFFRFQVSGDVLNDRYFAGMVQCAIENPGTTYLAFTKRYNVVNKWIQANGELPENLKILFSGWDNLKPVNPYNLPETTVFGTETTPAPEDSWNICGGNCTECSCRGCGCWKAEKGETIAFHIH